MEFVWDEEKNKKVIQDQNRGGYGFEDVVEAVESGNKCMFVPNPKYITQDILVIDIHGYAYCVPCIRKGEQAKLITMYPSRKWTKKLLGK